MENNATIPVSLNGTPSVEESSNDHAAPQPESGMEQRRTRRSSFSVLQPASLDFDRDTERVDYNRRYSFSVVIYRPVPLWDTDSEDDGVDEPEDVPEVPAAVPGYGDFFNEVRGEVQGYGPYGESSNGVIQAPAPRFNPWDYVREDVDVDINVDTPHTIADNNGYVETDSNLFTREFLSCFGNNNFHPDATLCIYGGSFLLKIIRVERLGHF